MPPETMNMKRLEESIAAYGADLERWPPGEREAGLALLSRSADARAQLRAAVELDAVLDLLDAPRPSAHLVARVMAAAPHQKQESPPPRQRVVPLHAGRRAGGYLIAPLAMAAMAILWLALSDPLLEPQTAQAPGNAATSDDVLMFAFADPDGFTSQVEGLGMLSDDYLALADAFDVPVDDL